MLSKKERKVRALKIDPLEKEEYDEIVARFTEKELDNLLVGYTEQCRLFIARLGNDNSLTHPDLMQYIEKHGNNKDDKILGFLKAPYLEHLSTKWKDIRGLAITATDAYSIQNIQRGCETHYLTYFKKTRNIGGFLGTATTRWGNDNEQGALNRYALEKKVTVMKLGLMFHNKYGYLAATPDGINVEEGVLVEVKCPVSRKPEPGVVPNHYLPQVQFMLEVLDLEYCDFVQYQVSEWFKGGNGFWDVTRVKRDREWFQKSLESWQRIMKFILAKREIDGVYLDLDNLELKLPFGPPDMPIEKRVQRYGNLMDCNNVIDLDSTPNEDNPDNNNTKKRKIIIPEIDLNLENEEEVVSYKKHEVYLTDEQIPTDSEDICYFNPSSTI